VGLGNQGALIAWQVGESAVKEWLQTVINEGMAS